MINWRQPLLTYAVQKSTFAYIRSTHDDNMNPVPQSLPATMVSQMVLYLSTQLVHRSRYYLKKTTQTLLTQENNSAIITSREQLRQYYLKRTTKPLLPQENNSDSTTSSEQLRLYYLKRTTKTVLPQENNSDITTSREQLRYYYLKRATPGSTV